MQQAWTHQPTQRCCFCKHAHLDVEARLGAGLNEHHVVLPRFRIALLNGHLPVAQATSACCVRCCKPIHVWRVPATGACTTGNHTTQASYKRTSCQPGPSCYLTSRSTQVSFSLIHTASPTEISTGNWCLTNQDDDDVAAALCPDLVNPARRIQEGLSVWNVQQPAVCQHVSDFFLAWATSKAGLGEAHLIHHIPPPQQTSPGCSSVSSSGSAPVLQCPCATAERLSRLLSSASSQKQRPAVAERTTTAAGLFGPPGTSSLTESLCQWSPALIKRLV